MKTRQNYKFIKSLNKLIKSGEIAKPVMKTEHFFDVENVSFKIEYPSYELSVFAQKKTSAIYPDLYIVLLNDPQHKLLNQQDNQDGQLIERDSALARMVFNRLENFYNKKTK